MMEQGKSEQVKRRRVFYIPGYDPIHPRRYRELYRKEGAAQAEISDYTLSLTPKKARGKGGPSKRTNLLKDNCCCLATMASTS